MEKGARHRHNAGSGRPSLVWLSFSQMSASVRIHLLPPERLVADATSRLGAERTRSPVPRADESEDVASVHHGDTGERLLTVARAEVKRRIRSGSFRDPLEDLASGRPQSRPGPLHQTYDRMSDDRAQPSLGQASSMMAARMAPVAAAAAPRRKASLVRKRDKKEDETSCGETLFWFDMAESPLMSSPLRRVLTVSGAAVPPSGAQPSCPNGADG